jgi:hypothetical protein
MTRVLSSTEEPLPANGVRAQASAVRDIRPNVAADADPSASETPMASGQVVVGKLVAHGLHAHPSGPGQETSYFVLVETNYGQRTILGKDLQAAMAQSVTQPRVGDEIAVRYVAPGSGTVEACKPRNSWRVEKRDFFEARAKAAETLRNRATTPFEGSRRHPELVGSYLHLRAAELAAKNLRDLEDRKTFVEKVRDALADSIERGDPFPVALLKQRPPGPSDLVREQVSVRR